MYIKEYGASIRSVSGQHVCTLFPALPLAADRGSTINVNVSVVKKTIFFEKK